MAVCPTFLLLLKNFLGAGEEATVTLSSLLAWEQILILSGNSANIRTNLKSTCQSCIRTEMRRRGEQFSLKILMRPPSFFPIMSIFQIPFSRYKMKTQPHSKQLFDWIS